MENNELNTKHWGVVVDNEGKIIEGGIKEAVRRELVTEENCLPWWGLAKRASGDVYDMFGKYGERNVEYRRLVDGVVVPVQEGLFVDSDWEEEDY